MRWSAEIFKEDRCGQQKVQGIVYIKINLIELYYYIIIIIHVHIIIHVM